jgi:hypothetical protein
MNTTEYNKLIAEFMGLSFCTKHLYEGWYKNKEHNERICDYAGLKYHNEWNSLMPVVQKIDEMGYNVTIGRIYCSITPILEDENIIASLVCGDISKKIEIVYGAVVQFIQQYNKDKN